MTALRRSDLVRLGLVLLMLVLAGMACSLAGGDGDDDEADSTPTSPPTVTPPLTRTAIPTFTPFPTWTPSGGFGSPPTATAIVFRPTSTPFPTLRPQPTALPFDVRISYPVDGSQVAGYVTIVGSASHPRFLQYAIEWGPHPNPSNLWYPLTGPQLRPVINGGLAAWDTRTIPDGEYQLRLHVWLSDGTETFALATGLRVSNQAPTAQPTLTPTPRPNRLPVISPIPGQVVQAGDMIRVDVTVNDPDGDAVNLFVSSSNPSIANSVVANNRRIRVNGVTAGTATITVTANDNRGGLSSTAFVVTVQGQNRAPSISPVLNQAIDEGQARDVAIAVSDPDGDALSVTATSTDPNVVTASIPNNNAVRLVGVAEGTATVTVTVNDGKGGIINTAFQVNVGAVNRPPNVDPIPPQTLTVGDTREVPYVATDPDGDTLSAVAQSDTPGVATASVTAPGIITLVAAGEGAATVTLTVNDGNTAAVITTFSVNVVVGNQPPTIDSIAPQTMSVGETRDVTVTIRDPDGDALTTTATSDNTAVVTTDATAPGVIQLNAVGDGTATVTLSVDDGNNPAVTTSFTVSVAAVNQPPLIETIFEQVLGEGETRDVAYTATDPDGDSLTATATSDNDAVVAASVTAPGTIQLVAGSAGTATVTLTVDDGNNPAVSMPFTVQVVANEPPTIAAIPDQTMTSGEARDIAYTATDPDGDTLTATATSDNDAVVTASVTVPGTIQLVATGTGVATVTLSVDDGNNPAVTTSFTVTVGLANQPPTVDAIPNQTLTVGQTLDVTYTALDVDNDPLTATTSSDNDAVATASVTAPGTIQVVGVAEGSATVTLSVDDGANPPVTTSFLVTVGAANQPPTVAAIPNQTVTVRQTLDVAYTATDSEGDALTATASSDNGAVATASVTAPGTIQVVGVAEGSATVTLSVDDGSNPAVTTSFTVTVGAANQPPTIAAILNQTVTVGQTLDVAYTATDPEGDALTATASSDNDAVATASVTAPGTIQVVGVAEGSATVTLSVDDGSNLAVTTSFTVTVGAANQPPTITAIPAQTVVAGQTLDVFFTVTDPEGDALTATASSDNGAVATASMTAPGTIQVVGVAEGSATVTLSVDDGTNPPVTASFPVTVSAANANPVLQPIPDQVVPVGQTVNIPVAASDPDGDPVTLLAVSDAPGVATAAANGATEVVLTGVVPGTATITVEATDGRGGSATITFLATVEGVNNPPVIAPDPIPEQTVNVGEQITVSISVTDPEGDAVVVTALAADTGIALAEALGTDTIQITGVAPGVTAVNLTADDAKGGVTNASFNVVVSQVDTFNLMDYPVLPDIPPDMAQSLAQVFQSGVLNFGNQPTAFVKIGDDAMDSPNFLVPFASPGYDLGTRGGLQGIIDFFSGGTVRSDPAINSFNVDSVAAGASYGIDTLAGPAPAGPPCDAVGGGTILSCEVQLSKPSVALISFTGPNVTYMNPEQFRSELQVLVSDLLSNYGVIPVLATIPAGNGYTTEQLQPYNEVIVEVATQSGVAGVPLWNLWRAMQERGITDPNSVAPQGAGNLTDGALSFGFNVRNLTALQTLRAVQQGVGIQ